VERLDKDFCHDLIDLHVHASPCIYERIGNELDISERARGLGYRAILFKCHHTLNADRAFLIRKTLPGFEVHGGFVLNYFVGGINPEAVEAAIMSGAKEVWMPVFHSDHRIKKFGHPGLPNLRPVKEVTRHNKVWKGISILNSAGEIIPELREILCMIADEDIILGTGHLGLEEIFPLIDAAKREGVKKVLITHPEHILTGWPIEDQVRMADMGAVIEHCYVTANLDRVANSIIAVGPKRCVMATDGGTMKLPPPTEIMKTFAEEMLMRGITEKDIETMTKTNPTRLLSLT
jgi:hypothetical protein